MGNAEAGHSSGTPERHRVDGRQVHRKGWISPAGPLACST